MAVFTHSEDDEIEYGLANLVEGGDAAKFGLGFLGGVGVFGFAVDSMDLFGADAKRIKQELAGCQEIGLRVSRRNAAFVREEEMNMIDVVAFGTDLRHDGLVKGLRNPAAGERNVKREAIGNGLNEVAGGGFGERLGGGEILEFDGHRKPSGARAATRPPISFDRLGIAPGVAGLGEEVFGGDRAPGAGGIEFAVGEGFAFPTFADGIDNAPRGFDFVAADEEGGVTGKGFEKEAFVGFGCVCAELAVVAEMHAHRADLQARAGNFAVEAQGDSFVGLEPQRDGVGVEFLSALGGEKDVRGVAELDADFAGAQGKRFAGAQIKRDAGPAPIINPELQRDVRFDVGIGFYLFFLPIAGTELAIHDAGEVLAADDLFGNVGGRERTDRFEEFYFFIANRFGVERDRRFHRDKGEDLEQMVLDHVADGASFLVVTTAAADAKFFGDGDLDVIDRLAVPELFEDGVRKTEHQNVLNGFLAEVMVDAEDLFFVGVTREVRV